MIMLAIKIISIIVEVTVLGIVAAKYADYWLEIPSGCIRLSFDQFINLYNVCPDKWALGSQYNGEVIYTPGYCWHKAETIYMKSFISYIKLRWYKKGVAKNKAKQRLTKRQAELLKYWQQDINNFYK